MLRKNLIQATVLCCMALGVAYIGADGAAVARDCADYDFSVCMEGWECLADGRDCDDFIAVTGSDCVTTDYSCEWTWRCLGKNPTLVCGYGDGPVH
jgi:hypothetical protein